MSVALFASLSEWWGSLSTENRDLLAKAVGLLLSGGFLVTGTWTLAQKYRSSRMRLLEDQTEHLKDRTVTLESEKVSCDQRADDAEARAVQLQDTNAILQRESAADRMSVVQLNEQLAAESQQRQRMERRVGQAIKLDGQLWAAKALQGRPKFRPLAERQAAIVAVLNLKGGVGKTTITANLGRAFASKGYRVLLLDLDLQGSLTSLLLSQEKITQLHKAKGLMQHFLRNSLEDKTEKLTAYAQPVFADLPEGGSLDLVGTTDALAYAELSLTLHWLMRSGSRDSRFLLRKALHLKSLSARYDIVLLDCPPVVNVSCVNALAASDFLLVPTVMSRKSHERVPVLLRRILRNEKFRTHVNLDLKLLGLVANRSARAELTTMERAEWEALAVKSREALEQPVRRFSTILPNRADIRDLERDFQLPGTESPLNAAFAALATEIEQELPHDCRRLAKAFA